MNAQQRSSSSRLILLCCKNTGSLPASLPATTSARAQSPNKQKFSYTIVVSTKQPAHGSQGCPKIPTPNFCIKLAYGICTMQLSAHGNDPLHLPLATAFIRIRAPVCMLVSARQQAGRQVTGRDKHSKEKTKSCKGDVHSKNGLGSAGFRNPKSACKSSGRP
jgi:hypothetical protein